MTARSLRTNPSSCKLATLLLVFAVPLVVVAEERNMPYVELEGTIEEFTYHREWRSYYWREDFTLVVRDKAGVQHRVISREPTPWVGLRFGTTYTGLEVDWNKKPQVQIIGVGAIDRIPAEFYDLQLDPAKTITAFIVRVRTAEDKPWQDYYVNNWFHRWGAEPDAKLLPQYAIDDPNYTIYGYESGRYAPLDAASQKLFDQLAPAYNGVIYHARVVKADNPIGYALHLIHLVGRHKTTAEYEVFLGDEKELIPLDGRKPRFVDVTAESSIKIADNTGVGGTNPHAVAIEDFNGDGLPELVIPTFGAPHIRYFRNAGQMKFVDATAGSGLENFAGEGTGAAVADFNHDGHLDLYLTSLRKGASRLYQGRGDGTFVDVSEERGVLLTEPARSCAWSDIDGDGWADLFVCCPDGPNRLFRNLKNGTFEDIAAVAGVADAESETLGCVFGDIDGDDRDDLFLANYHSQPDRLLKNLGGGKFQNITDSAGLTRNASSVGCVLADVFNRGRLDLYVTTDSWLSGANYTETELLSQQHSVEPNQLYAGDGQGRFTPVVAETLLHKTLSHDAVLEDLDHDGRVEIYVGVDAIPTGNRFATHKGGNPLWTRDAKGDWHNVAAEWGADYQGNCVCVPAADLDGDGDLDLVLINFYSNVKVYRNETNDRRWLQVKAVGTKSNPDAIGAKVKVFATVDGKEKLVGYRQIQSGAGYCRVSPLMAHFGLGEAAELPLRVEVRFPFGNRVVQENVAAGSRIVVREEPAAQE